MPNTKLRYEINLLQFYGLSTTGTALQNIGHVVQLDTDKYPTSGVTYYFEVTGSVASGTQTSRLRRNGTTTDDSTINHTTSTPTRTRSSFTPPSGVTEYSLVIDPNGTASTKVVYSARIIILVDAPSIPISESQFDFAEYASTTSTTFVVSGVNNGERYWKYNSAHYDGSTVQFFWEASVLTSSSKSPTIVELQTSSNLTTPSWSAVGSDLSVTSTVSTRFRTAFTPVNGNIYRLVFKSGSSKSNATLTGGKIIVQQFEGSSGSLLFNGTFQVLGSGAGGGILEAIAQSFKVSNATNPITGVKLLLSKSGSPTDNLILDIVSALDGSSLAQATLAASSLSTGPVLTTLTFGTPFTPVAGTTYYLQFTRSAAIHDGTNCVNIQASGESYPDGGSWARTSGSWAPQSGLDINFELVGNTGITKLEAQYILLANKVLSTTPTTQKVYYDHAEWQNVTNTFTAEVSDVDNSAITYLLRDTANTTTYATVASPDNIGSASASMPGSATELDIRTSSGSSSLFGSLKVINAVVVTVVAPATAFTKNIINLQAVNRAAYY